MYLFSSRMLNAAPLSLTGGRPDTVGLVLISSDFANSGLVEWCLLTKCIIIIFSIMVAALHFSTKF